MVYYTAVTASYQSAFNTVDIQTRTCDLILVTFGSLFVNVVFPAGGAGDAALFAEDRIHGGKPAAHALDIVRLYILFLAFNQPVNFGALVAGYAICILFWIVSPTPQGIGIVDGMMALTFTSLGIPGAASATISLVICGSTFRLPMLPGFFAVRRMRMFGENQRILTKTWGVRLTRCGWRSWV